MNDYDKRFKNKFNSYIYAQLNFPNVMKHEFETALELCKDKLQKKVDYELVFVNIPAEILFERYLFDLSFPNKVEYIPFEFSKEFASLSNFRQTNINHIDMPDQSVDIIMSIASLHHFTIEERLIFYKECRRILKPDGVFIIGDVLKGSKQDIWLNQFVNEYNSNGHNGIFFEENEKLSLQEAGFKVEIQHKQYTWNFDSTTSMCEYCINLFGLNKINSSSFLLKYLYQYLQYNINDDLTCEFPWSLIYFKSTVCQA